MRVMVLGAGVVGTASAWYLARAGHEVTVVERQGGPALETSFANGGQISVSHAEPWANPGAPAKILKWLGREDAPLLFRPGTDPRQWAWGLRFLVECLPSRTRANTRHLIALGLYSRGALQQLRRDTGIAYDEQLRGILHFFTDAREYETALRHGEWMRQFGIERLPRTPDECVALEPALAQARHRIAGGTYTPSDESGDARMFTDALAARAAASGVRFFYGASIRRLEAAGDRVSGVVVTREGDDDEERITADAYVVALGSYSPLVVRPLGVSIPVYPLKGYSITVPLEPADDAPRISLTDEAAKLVFSRLGDRLRIAGTAELAGYDTQINTVRCEAIARRAFDLFPNAGRPERAEYWTGLRPATPSNSPCIGRTRYANLFLNTGHGTLGWTLACGSGQAIADIVSGRQPQADFPFLGIPRAAAAASAVEPS